MIKLLTLTQKRNPSQQHNTKSFMVSLFIYIFLLRVYLFLMSLFVVCFFPAGFYWSGEFFMSTCFTRYFLPTYAISRSIPNKLGGVIAIVKWIVFVFAIPTCRILLEIKIYVFCEPSEPTILNLAIHRLINNAVARDVPTRSRAEWYRRFGGTWCFYCHICTGIGGGKFPPNL